MSEERTVADRVATWLTLIAVPFWVAGTYYESFDLTQTACLLMCLSYLVEHRRDVGLGPRVERQRAEGEPL